MLRSAALVAVLFVAGCASESGDTAPTSTTLATPTPASPTPGTSAAPAPSPTPPAPTTKLGVVLDEAHDYTTTESQSFFNVTGAEKAVVINITSSGPPGDGSFQSATLHLYFPRTTSPFVAELPGEAPRSYELRQQPHEGMWKLDYRGTGKVVVHVRVTLE